MMIKTTNQKGMENMKKLTKLLALVLALALILSLGACSKKESITGTWKYAFSLEQAMNAAGAMDDLPAGMESLQDTLKATTFNMIMDLKEDGTYEMKMDEASVKSALEKFKEDMKGVMPDMLKSEAEKYEMSVDALLETMGMTMDEAVDFVMEQMDTDAMVGELGELSEKGKYTFENGKLTMTSESGDEDVLTAELKGSELKITAIEGESDMSEGLKEMLPMVFKK